MSSLDLDGLRLPTLSFSVIPQKAQFPGFGPSSPLQQHFWGQLPAGEGHKEKVQGTEPQPGAGTLGQGR